MKTICKYQVNAISLSIIPYLKDERQDKQNLFWCYWNFNVILMYSFVKLFNFIQALCSSRGYINPTGTNVYI